MTLYQILRWFWIGVFSKSRESEEYLNARGEAIQYLKDYLDEQIADERRQLEFQRDVARITSGRRVA
jgi:ferritin